MKLTYLGGFFLALIVFSCAAQSSNELSPKEYQTKLSVGNAIVLDVRTEAEFKSGHLQNAININVGAENFDRETDKLDKSKPVFVYCAAGVRSHRAHVALEKKGFKVYDLQGGLSAWSSAGLPIVK